MTDEINYLHIINTAKTKLFVYTKPTDLKPIAIFEKHKNGWSRNGSVFGNVAKCLESLRRS